MIARDTKVLAANQSLHNVFLAAGLAWGLWLADAGRPIAIFCLSCVLIAGLYGSETAIRKILFVRALPAGLALAVVLDGL